MSKLTDDIKANFGGTVADANKAIESVTSAIVRTLKADGKVVVPGLGTLKFKPGGVARTGRNPATGGETSYVTKGKVSLNISNDVRSTLD